MNTLSTTSRGPAWGCIADDFTGATDLATSFVGQGLATAVFFGVPGSEVIGAQADLDVAVIALKSRTAPVDEAVTDSLAALDVLRDAGASRFYFKYCSTFDSTPQGNIGPVIDALLAALGERLTIVVPSFPEGGRTVYLGHLFVGRQLLSESPMCDHPLTPMRDANLVRVLAPQTAGDVALIPLSTVRQGAAALRHELDRISAESPQAAAVVVDAVDRDDLATIMRGAAQLPLITGGSGLAQGLTGSADGDGHAREIPRTSGRRAILCGSVSARTREQIATARRVLPSIKLDPGALRADSAQEARRVVAWTRTQWEANADAIPLIFSADSLTDVDRSADAEPLSALVERALGAVARELVADGVRQLIVAGGETSGRVVQDLGVASLRIGPSIAPGVAWSAGRSRDGVPLVLALKSGNFGAPDMFLSAWQLVDADPGPLR